MARIEYEEKNSKKAYWFYTLGGLPYSLSAGSMVFLVTNFTNG